MWYLFVCRAYQQHCSQASCKMNQWNTDSQWRWNAGRIELLWCKPFGCLYPQLCSFPTQDSARIVHIHEVSRPRMDTFWLCTLSSYNMEHVIGARWLAIPNQGHSYVPQLRDLWNPSNLFWLHVFLVAIFTSTPNHTPLKYRCPIKISKQVRSANLCLSLCNILRKPLDRPWINWAKYLMGHPYNTANMLTLFHFHRSSTKVCWNE